MKIYADICSQKYAGICKYMHVKNMQKYVIYMHYIKKYAIGNIYRNMPKYVIENMQKYEYIGKNMQKNICKNMQKYARKLYANICNLYANICII